MHKLQVTLTGGLFASRRCRSIGTDLHVAHLYYNTLCNISACLLESNQFAILFRRLLCPVCRRPVADPWSGSPPSGHFHSCQKA